MLLLHDEGQVTGNCEVVVPQQGEQPVVQMTVMVME